MEDRKDLIKNILKGVLVMIIFYESYLFQYIPIFLFKMDVKKISYSTSILLNCFANLVLVVIFTFMYKKELVLEFKKFKSKLFDNINIAFNCWVVGLFIMIVSNVLINLFFKTGGAANEQAVQRMISSLPWIMLINAGIIAPFNEEIVFRKTLKNVFKNKYVFIFLSFFIFGLVHVLGSATSWVDYLYVVPYGALGGAFALAYYKTDSVFTSMFMHMFHNFSLTLFSILLAIF